MISVFAVISDKTNEKSGKMLIPYGEMNQTLSPLLQYFNRHAVVVFTLR